MKAKLYGLAKKVGALLKKKKLLLVTAESCTGGLLAASITDIPGSSVYFEQGFVVYSNIAKEESLGVKSKTIKKFGAVSEEVAKEMAKGALQRSHADVVITVTGVAGPTGGTKNKPKGTVCFALVGKGLVPKTFTMYFKGNRDAVRMEAVEFALKKLLMLDG